MMRLDKYLAAQGLGSRSDVKKIISAGIVSINDIPCRDPGFRLNEDKDSVTLEGERLNYEKHVYFMLNKPGNVISASRRDLRNRDLLCVVDLIPEEVHRELFPVGRLDRDTEGLLLITDDGALAHELLSPKKHVDKEYFVRLRDGLSEGSRMKIESGIDIGDEKPALPAVIRMLNDRELHIIIHEGRFHEIKRMFEAVGNEVVFLKRLRMGSLCLDPGLDPGEYRRLTDEELEALKK